MAETMAGLALLIDRSTRRRSAAMLVLAGLFAAAVLLSIGIGAVHISPGEAAALLLGPLGFDLPWQASPAQELVLHSIRLPRTLLAVLAGAALAVTGAALQGLFRNPLADPGLIGVSSGAALAAALVIVFGGFIHALLPPAAVSHALPVGAFAGGLVATLLIHRLASGEGRTDVTTMLLAGIAINALSGAGIGLVVFLSDDQQLRDLNFWLLGSVGGATWERLLPALPLVLPPILLLPRFAAALDALLLGEHEASHLGFEVERLKRRVVLLTALAVGATVALSGVIGFVGLVAPHLVRLLLGPDHKGLLPASVLLGASLLLLADIAARTVVAPAELPIGILTSLLGGPFFLWLLLRQRRRGGLA